MVEWKNHPTILWSEIAFEVILLQSRFPSANHLTVALFKGLSHLLDFADDVIHTPVIPNNSFFHC